MGVSTTHRINLSMWILIYSFSDTYYVWAACGVCIIFFKTMYFHSNLGGYKEAVYFSLMWSRMMQNVTQACKVDPGDRVTQPRKFRL